MQVTRLCKLVYGQADPCAILRGTWRVTLIERVSIIGWKKERKTPAVVLKVCEPLEQAFSHATVAFEQMNVLFWHWNCKYQAAYVCNKTLSHALSKLCGNNWRDMLINNKGVLSWEPSTGNHQTVCSLAEWLMGSDDFSRDTRIILLSLSLFPSVPFALARNQLRFFTRWELEAAAPYYK